LNGHVNLVLPFNQSIKRYPGIPEREMSQEFQGDNMYLPHSKTHVNLCNCDIESLGECESEGMTSSEVGASAQPKGFLGIMQGEVELTKKETVELVEEVHVECFPSDLSGNAIKKNLLTALGFVQKFT